MPKAIIIKSISQKILKQLVDELSGCKNIRFFCKRINGEYRLLVKCFNYYDSNIEETMQNFCGNYIYLYTCISMILSDIIIEQYEKNLISRILNSEYRYLGKYRLAKISNITDLVLNSNTPIEGGKDFFTFRKQIILSNLLCEFRNKNYIYIDSFINFSLENYIIILDEIISLIIDLYLANSISIENLNVIIKNMFE